MTAYSPSVTVLILNWNGREVLPQCLDALLTLDYQAFRVIVADNGSNDGSLALVREKYPAVQSIDLGQNMGFSRGNNVAFSRIEDKSELLVLLNNDVYVRPDWLEQLVSPFSAPEVGISGAKLLFPDEIHIQHAGGELEYPSAMAHHIAYKEIDRGQVDDRREVPYVTGASLAIKWSLAEELGLFDEHFSPYYFEEADLCYRTRAAGYKIIYVPEAVAIHHEAFSAVKFDAQTAYAFHCNRLRMVLKHYTDDQLLNDFIPAELIRLQTMPMSADGLESIRRAYLETMLALSSKDALSDSDRTILGALSQWWEASLRVDPEHVPGLILGKPFIDPLFRKVLAVWQLFASKVLFWPIVKRQRATNALLWRAAQELAMRSSDVQDEELVAKELMSLRKELRRIGQ